MGATQTWQSPKGKKACFNIYVDDCNAFSDNMDSHISGLWCILSNLLAAELTLRDSTFLRHNHNHPSGISVCLWLVLCDTLLALIPKLYFMEIVGMAYNCAIVVASLFPWISQNGVRLVEESEHVSLTKATRKVWQLFSGKNDGTVTNGDQVCGGISRQQRSHA